MEMWLTVAIGLLGFAAIVSIPAAVWALVVWGIVDVIHKRRGDPGSGKV
jgi:hypothetical protein